MCDLYQTTSAGLNERRSSAGYICSSRVTGFRTTDSSFSTVVPRNVRLAEAPSYGMPGVVYDRASRGAQAYISFGAEMIERVRKDLN